MRPDTTHSRIAITGTAAFSAHGRGVAAILDAITRGVRPLRPARRAALAFAAAGSDGTASGAEPPAFEAQDERDDRSAEGRAAWRWASDLAVETATAAAAEAGLDRAGYRPGRAGVFAGTTHGSDRTLALVRAQVAGSEPTPAIFGSSSSGDALRIARVLLARGPAITINTACSSSLHAIGQAARLIRAGAIDCAVAGGHDVISALTFRGFQSLRAVSAAGCRPFDVERDGLTLGDGAAYLVLERDEAARARGVHPLGWIEGYAAAAEDHHATAPDPEGWGAHRVMAGALAASGDPGALRLVSAHGTGTPANDAMELKALGALVESAGLAAATGGEPSDRVDVFSLKSWFGHTLGAAGALEVVTTLACMRAGIIPGTAGLRAPAPHHPRLHLSDTARTVAESVFSSALALCNSFAFGGNVASLCIRANPPIGARPEAPPPSHP